MRTMVETVFHSRARRRLGNLRQVTGMALRAVGFMAMSWGRSRGSESTPRLHARQRRAVLRWADNCLCAAPTYAIPNDARLEIRPAPKYDGRNLAGSHRSLKGGWLSRLSTGAA